MKRSNCFAVFFAVVGLFAGKVGATVTLLSPAVSLSPDVSMQAASQSDEASQPRLVRVQTEDVTLALLCEPDGRLSFAYFGPTFSGDEALIARRYIGRPDAFEDMRPSAYLAYGGRNYLEPALKVVHADGSQTVELVVEGVETESLDSNRERTVVRMRDKLYPMSVELIYTAYRAENVITQQVCVHNEARGKRPIELENVYSAYMPVMAPSYYLTHFYGTWAHEMQLVEERLTPGVKTIESRKGVRTTQSENPSFLLSTGAPARADEGEVIAGALAWSGNYKLSFELDESGRLNVLGGVNPFGSRYRLETGDSFTTPEMIWSYSASGYGLAARQLHDWTRQYALHDGETVNSVVLNSWEGAYFNFDEATICRMIDDAASMGVETFVLDDGWFGNNYPRNDDRAGLGDWQVNRQKLPGGIDSLARYAVSKGLRFGIWIEPEMVNPASDLAQAHPDWVVKSPGREVPTMRNQWLLDLTNPEVQDFVVETFRNTVGLSSSISYIKWDANRHVESMGSEYLPEDRQSHFWIDYTRGLYSVYERIRKEFPDIEIQLCSSGGGRLDYGALQYHDEFWTSDDTDAYERIKMQFATNLIYPAEATAAHVSIVPNHQTGDRAPLKLRFDVAMMGRLGLELQPRHLTDEEFAFARRAVETYKDIRPVIQLGDLYPLRSPYEPGDWCARMFVSKDKSRAVFFAFSLDYHDRMASTDFKLQGLDPERRYKVTELNSAGSDTFWGNGQTFTGDYLMRVGVNPWLQRRGASTVLLLEVQP